MKHKSQIIVLVIIVILLTVMVWFFVQQKSLSVGKAITFTNPRFADTTECRTNLGKLLTGTGRTVCIGYTPFECYCEKKSADGCGKLKIIPSTPERITISGGNYISVPNCCLRSPQPGETPDGIILGKEPLSVKIIQSCRQQWLG